MVPAGLRGYGMTLPGIRTTVALLAILSLGNILNAGFDQIYNLYNPLVYSTGDIIDTYIYRIGIEQTQYSIAAAVGIVVLLVLIIKFKLHPVLSMMISAIIIGAGAGMPLTMISDTVEKGVGKTLQGIALLVGLGSMFGGILEVSGGARE